jgi:ABC-type Zn uptake system ZnuABC Zn-binding protein ZnuA
LLESLEILDHKLALILKPIEGKTALIDHDSLQYLEKRFGFTIRGVFFNDEGHPPSVKELKDFIEELDANLEENLTTVFFYSGTEKNVPPHMLQNVVEPYNLPLAQIDYDGELLDLATVQQTELFHIILTNLANDIVAGFSTQSTKRN